MYPWRRILVPTDFSTASAWAFDDAVRIAGSTQAEVLILHVRMTRPSSPGELRFPADESLYAYAEQVELNRLRDTLRMRNASIATRLLVRTAPAAGAEIGKTALAEDADLVVMATHGRHHVAHLILGSTTRAALDQLRVPVLTIRYGIHLHGAMRRIVVPIHSGQESTPALDLAAAIVRNEGGELRLVTVCPDKVRSDASERLRRLAADKLADVQVSSEVLIGTHVDREVLRHVQSWGGDSLFVNAIDDPSPLKLEIVMNAPVPVMVVPSSPVPEPVY